MEKYVDLIEQTFFFPTEEFTLDSTGQLLFNEVPLMPLIEKYGTPLKLTYLPKISLQINRAKKWFNEAIEKYNYEGTYTYCYCTKSSHFEFVMSEALKNDIHLETSSAFDIMLIRKLIAKGSFTKDNFVICNGFKTDEYKLNISNFINDGYNCIPVLDNLNEIEFYDKHITTSCNLAIRIAADEEPKSEFYTSRLGVRINDIMDLYKRKIKDNPKFKLKMLHFFINSGVKDTTYYWSELSRFIELYCELKAECPDLDSMDIGGGFPIKTSVHFDYNYEYMVGQIVMNIKKICDSYNVKVPHLFTEFGSFTVGESGAVLYKVLDSKLQNDKELWYLINSSFITTLPDIWGLNQKYLMLAINNWNSLYRKVNIGGITCDGMDYYNSEAHSYNVYLPRLKEGEDQYVGFFHTGAYQESLGGYGGIQHCLIPAPKHVIINKNEEGEMNSFLFAEEQRHEDMLRILGY